MDNFKSPSAPFVDKEEGIFFSGFTKLELSAILIATGFVSSNLCQFDPETVNGQKTITSLSVAIAKAVLEEANK